MIKRLRSIFLDNFLIKLFSLLFAVLLWMYASSRVQSETNFVVPLEIRDIPASMMVVGDATGFVEVRLKGDEAYIKGLTYRDVGAFISLKSAAVGESTYYLSPSNIRRPANVTVSRVSPVEVRLSLDRVAHKQLAVRTVTKGRPAAGVKVRDIHTVPGVVAASGPKKELDRLTEITTEPVDLEGLTGGFERQVDLALPDSPDVVLEDDRVTVIVNTTKDK